MTDPTHQAQQSARTAARSETARKAVLLGWAAKGVVYVALAWIVLQSAFGAAPEQSSTTGALQLIAQSAPGRIALMVLGVGLLAFAVGRILETTVLAEPQIGARDKAQAVVLALVYTSLAVTAFSIVGLAGGSGGGSGGGSEQQGSAFLLGLPAGRWLVGLLGLLVVAFGLYEVYLGVKQKFRGTLRSADMSPAMRSASTKIGIAAYVTKGLIFVLLGYFFLQSALSYDPSEAKGLDAALREVSQAAYGQVLLSLVALGLLAYGLFAFIEARYRRIGSSASGTT